MEGSNSCSSFRRKEASCLPDLESLVEYIAMVSKQCEQCLAAMVHITVVPHENDAVCVSNQKMYGCHACGRESCFSNSASCPYSRFRGKRLDHPDAISTGNIEHMSQVRISCLRGMDEIQAQVRLSGNWWLFGPPVTFIVNDIHLRMGQASGDGCNCLIDSLRQCLNMQCIVAVLSLIHI